MERMPWVSNQAYFRGTALIRGIRVVIDYPTGSTHSENLWSRANFDLYYFNKSYIFNIPSHYSRLSFREPLGGIIWVSHNCNNVTRSNDGIPGDASSR